MEQHNFPEQEKKEEEDDDVEWLKLGLGLGISNTTDTSSSSCNKNIISHGSSNPVLYSSSLPSSSSSSQGLIITHHQEVGLRLGLGLLERGSQLGIVGSMVEPSRASYHHHHHHRNSLLGLSSSSLSGHCNYHHHHSSNNNNDGGGDNNGMNRLRPPSSSSCRIDSQGLPISVPYIDQSHHYPHHRNGVWFTLRSSTNRIGEALPQIPKAYIRVRDENMTVLMVKRYLVMKLGLSNETEIDISCMGESLSHIQTLKQVRDGVWLPRLIESLNSTTTLSSLGDSHDMSLHHIMSLLYRKHCFPNH